MTAARHQRLMALFDRARELEAGARETFLAAECADDDELRREVDRLLAHDSRSDALTDVIGIRGTLDSWLDSEETRPLQICAFTIARHLASGGMGEVYEAEQASPRRRVALKLVRPGLATPSALRRLRHEAETLGRLRHPGIAQIYEAGVHDQGAGGFPFFAMELIEGARPITEYVHEHGLGLRRRVELALDVCDAVGHGHQRGVVHRDLKPSNILVDAAGRVKIIDFGVAFTTDADLTRATRITDAREIVGTLQYMSPEQCLADGGEIDPRADVYALGVVLYQLLCGQLPYDLATASFPAAVATIRETIPPPPASLRPELRGDLATILHRTLEKDRAHRYRNAAELGDELRRYLADEPILARPPSALDTLRRLARRHRAATTAMSSSLVVVVVALVGLLGLSIAGASALANARSADAQSADLAEALWNDMQAGPFRTQDEETARLLAAARDAAAAAASARSRGNDDGAVEGYLRALASWDSARTFRTERRRRLLADVARRLEAGDFAAAATELDSIAPGRDRDELHRRLLFAWTDAVTGPSTRDEARRLADTARTAFPGDKEIEAQAAAVRLLFLDFATIELSTAAEPSLSRAFRISRRQISTGQYFAVVGRNPARLRHEFDEPVTRVSWFDAVDFCNRLSRHEGREPAYRLEIETLSPQGSIADARVERILGADGYRLPMEAEWAQASAREFFVSDDGTSGQWDWCGDVSPRSPEPENGYARACWRESRDTEIQSQAPAAGGRHFDVGFRIARDEPSSHRGHERGQH